MRRRGGFTLIEMVIAIFILIIILLLAVPSLTGVLADRRLRRSLDAFNDLVRQAQERSVNERRAYLIVWEDGKVGLRPEAFNKDETVGDTVNLPMRKGEALKLNLPAALMKKVPGEWIFWPCGTCEPASVQFSGRDGEWIAKFSPLTARPDIVKYVAR